MLEPPQKLRPRSVNHVPGVHNSREFNLIQNVATTVIVGGNRYDHDVMNWPYEQ
jgi:hypothetical protein